MHENKDISRGKNNHVSKQVFERRSPDFKGAKLKIMQLIDGSLSSVEIADKMGKNLSQISGRFSWLKQKGYIYDDRQKIINNNPYTVYCLTEKGFNFNLEFNNT